MRQLDHYGGAEHENPERVGDRSLERHAAPRTACRMRLFDMAHLGPLRVEHGVAQLQQAAAQLGQRLAVGAHEVEPLLEGSGLRLLRRPDRPIVGADHMQGCAGEADLAACDDGEQKRPTSRRPHLQVMPSVTGDPVSGG